MTNESTMHLSLQGLGLVDVIVKKIDNEKRISKAERADEVVAKLCDYIDAFNSLPAESMTIDGYRLDEIEVIKEFAEFIFPDSVRMDISTYTTKDLTVRGVRKQGFHFDKQEFENLQSKFRNYFKKDSVSERVTVASMRKQYNLTDIIPRVACPYGIKGKEVAAKNFKVRYLGEAFMPVFIDVNLDNFYHDFYFNALAIECVDDFMAKYKYN